MSQYLQQTLASSMVPEERSLDPEQPGCIVLHAIPTELGSTAIARARPSREPVFPLIGSMAFLSCMCVRACLCVRVCVCVFQPFGNSVTIFVSCESA